MRLLLSAYCCAPNSGSEQGFGWWWTIQCAKKHDVTVITNEAQKEEIEGYLSKNHISVRFEYVKGLKKVSPSGTAYRLERLHQYFWQLRAIKKVRALTKRGNFDLAHHITIGSWRLPSCLAFCSIPYIFGPTSGSEKLPPGFVFHLGIKGIVWEKFREVLICFASFDPFVRLTLNKATTILAAGPATYLDLKSKYPAKTLPFTRAFPKDSIKEKWRGNQRKNQRNEYLKISWVGRLIPRKGLEILLNALTDSELDNVILHVLGDGPNKDRYVQLANKLGIKDRVRFMGHLTQEEVFEKFRKDDVFAFTSLQDMMGQSLSEAMQIGIPCVILDWSGPSWLVGEDGAYKVQVSSYEKTCKNLAHALSFINKNPELRSELGEAATRRMRFLIDHLRLSNERDQIYEEAITKAKTGVNNPN